MCYRTPIVWSVTEMVRRRQPNRELHHKLFTTSYLLTPAWSEPKWTMVDNVSWLYFVLLCIFATFAGIRWHRTSMQVSLQILVPKTVQLFQICHFLSFQRFYHSSTYIVHHKSVCGYVTTFCMQCWHIATLQVISIHLVPKISYFRNLCSCIFQFIRYVGSWRMPFLALTYCDMMLFPSDFELFWMIDTWVKWKKKTDSSRERLRLC